MQATQILKDEHQVILRLLDAMEVASRRIELGNEMPAAFFMETSEVLHGFADDCHHRKEEGVLFKAMNARGVPVEGGPIGILLQEHEAGRALVRRMRSAAERWQGGDVSGQKEAARLALDYTALLRQHIAKENNVLFPMADRLFQNGDQGHLVEDFETVEHEETGAGLHEKYLAMVDELTAAASGT